MIPMTSEDALSADQIFLGLRGANETAQQQARTALAHVADPEQDTAHSALRAVVTTFLTSSLLPSDRPLVRYLLGEEVATQRAAGEGDTETLLTLAVALARFAQPDDALLLWQAHDVTAETREAVDVELIGRAGVDRVRQALQRIAASGNADSARDARNALAWLESGEALGAFADLPAYFTWAEDRYGIAVSGPV